MATDAERRTKDRTEEATEENAAARSSDGRAGPQHSAPEGKKGFGSYEPMREIQSRAQKTK
jgi:hypothetical protein